MVVDTLHLTLHPHTERDGTHTDRFDAYLGDQLICTSRSGWHDPARALLAMGYPLETLLRVQHAACMHDPTMVPQPIGELAKWTIKERDRGGLSKEHLEPWQSSPVASPAGAEQEAA